MYTLVDVFQIVTLLIGTYALLFMLKRRMEVQQRYLIYTCFGAVIYDIGQMLEITAGFTWQVAYAGREIELIGVTIFYIGLILLCSQQAGLVVSNKIIYAMIILDVVLIFLCFRNNSDNQVWHNFFYRNITFVSDGCYPHLETVSGPGQYIYWTLLVSLPELVSLAMIFFAAYRAEEPTKRKKLLIFGMEMLVSLILDVFSQVMPDHIFKPYNPAMAVATWIMAFNIFRLWRNDGIDLVSVAAEQALDTLDAGIVVFDRENQVVYRNEMVRHLFPGWRGNLPEEVPAELKFDPEHHEESISTFSFMGGFYQVHYSPVGEGRDYYGRHALIIDLTEENGLIQEIQEQREIAESANSAKSEFLSSLSHEVRTPLNAIIGMSELITERNQDEDTRDMADSVFRAATGLLNIMENVVDYSELEAGNLQLETEEYSIRELMEGIYQSVSLPASAKGLVVNTYLDPSIPSRLRGDADKIRRVLLNLMTNAVKFTRMGTVEFSVEGERYGEEVELTFTIKDSGIGISAEDQETIFESFRQLEIQKHRTVEGIGLGLTIAKGLVELMEGEISVKSEVGIGSVFRVRLTQPIVDFTSLEDEDSESRTGEEEKEKKFTAREISALVVDDNMINRMMVVGLLEPYEMAVDEAESGLAAIELAGQKDYDIIMMDHMMPEMDGIEATDRIRQICADRKRQQPYIVAMTANNEEGARQMYLSSGFDDYLPKPVDHDRLRESLMAAIPENKRQYVQEETAPTASGITFHSVSSKPAKTLSIEGIDMDYAMSLHNGSKDDFVELLDLYTMEGAEKRPLMEKYFDQKDWHNYEVLVHGLKSTSLSIGAKELSEHAKSHEMAAKEGNETYIISDAQKLFAQYDEMRQRIEAAVADYRGVTKTVSEKSLPAGELESRLNEALAASEDFRTKDAADLLEGLQVYDLPKDAADMIKEALRLYKMYDDDTAEETIRSFLNQ